MLKNNLENYDVIVIGGGQAGLATAYHLQKAGARFLILEGAAQATGSWSRYYESLTLFSPLRYSGLPGFAFPGPPDSYPSRDDVVAYLQQYGERFKFPIVTNAPVQAIVAVATGFEVHTENTVYLTKAVVAATGSYNRPNIPHYPNQETFTGTLLHSVQYANPAPFHNQRVVVMGGGNSAVQIAVELAETAHVTLTSRRKIPFTPQLIRGKDVHWWESRLGLGKIPIGHFQSIAHKAVTQAGVLDFGNYKAAVNAQKPDWRPIFSAFTENGVRWSDGDEEAVDTVLFATGFRPNLTYLPTTALQPNGRPHHRIGVSTTHPGLYFMGFSGQRTITSATLRGVGADAKYIVKQIMREARGR